MKRPEVTLENYKAIYEFYKQHRQGRRAARFLHGVLGLAFKPDVIYAKGAKESLGNILESGRSIVLASNHTRAVDPCVIATLPEHEDVLRPLRGNTFIPSKKSIQATPVVRRLVDGLGAVPTFRLSDITSEADVPLFRGASRALIQTAIARMDDGQHMAVFPEGERNKSDTNCIQPLQKGIGLMVCKVSAIEQPAIVPMAIHYASGKPSDIHRPTVYIDNPSAEPFPRGKDLLAWLPDRLQASLDAARQG